MAVAWGCVLCDGRGVKRDEQQEVFEWSRGVPQDWPRPYSRTLFQGFGHNTLSESVLLTVGHRGVRYELAMHRAGWPVLAVGCTERVRERYDKSGFNPLERTTDGFTFPFLWSGDDRTSVLPVLPLFTGFLVDTVFYGVLASVVWSTPGFVRRRVRRRRGRCLRCGYELKGLVPCPECGA